MSDANAQTNKDISFFFGHNRTPISQQTKDKLFQTILDNEYFSDVCCLADFSLRYIENCMPQFKDSSCKQLIVDAEWQPRSHTCPTVKSVGNEHQLFKSLECWNCFSAGKCKDMYVRLTLGAVLFPQFYANEKQK